jgi:hypothetical protein
MVLHVYHAELEGKAFTTELDIENPDDPQSFASAVRAHIDETSDSILEHVKPVKCQSCSKREATTLLHHPMLFAEADPPRVEDILSPVCGLAECTRAASGEIELALAQKHALSGLDAQVGDFILQCDNCSKVGTSEEPLAQCSRCKSARYCSAACQKAHWPRHKVACQK